MDMRGIGTRKPLDVEHVGSIISTPERKVDAMLTPGPMGSFWVPNSAPLLQTKTLVGSFGRAKKRSPDKTARRDPASVPRYNQI